jgi:hypothetical protein
MRVRDVLKLIREEEISLAVLKSAWIDKKGAYNDKVHKEYSTRKKRLEDIKERLWDIETWIVKGEFE